MNIYEDAAKRMEAIKRGDAPASATDDPATDKMAAKRFDAWKNRAKHDQEWVGTTTRPIEEPPILLDRYRQGGLNVIHGIPGIGKSWFAMNDSLTLARHEHLDLDVRYATWDMNEAATLLMYQTLGAKDGEIRLLARDTPLDGEFSPELHRHRILNWATLEGKRALIFMDRLDQYSTGDGRATSASVNASINWFLQLTATGATVITLSHQVQGSERLEGHQALEGSMEGIVTLSAAPDRDNQTIHWQAHRRGINAEGYWSHERLNSELAIKRFQPRRKSQGGSAGEDGERPTPALTKVLDYLDANSHLCHGTAKLAYQQSQDDAMGFAQATFYRAWKDAGLS